jgi:hypothetical protein
MIELRGVIVLKLKPYDKYLGCVAAAACITLLYTNLSNIGGNNSSTVEDKPSRIVIESTEKNSVTDDNVLTSNEETRKSVPVADSTSEVQPLPVPDTNSQIIVTPLL